MNQDRNGAQDMPNRASNMEQAEGSRGQQQGRGSEGERNAENNQGSRSNTGGITNRPLDREQSEQDNLPERGQSQSER